MLCVWLLRVCAVGGREDAAKAPPSFPFALLPKFMCMEKPSTCRGRNSNGDWSRWQPARKGPEDGGLGSLTLPCREGLATKLPCY